MTFLEIRFLGLIFSLAFADSNGTYFFSFGYVLAEIYVAMLPKVAKKAKKLQTVLGLFS